MVCMNVLTELRSEILSAEISMNVQKSASQATRELRARIAILNSLLEFHDESCQFLVGSEIRLVEVRLDFK
jgi:hypothetical protein